MKSPWRGAVRGGKCQTSLPCALTQKGLLLENVLIDERKQRRPRSVVVVVIGDGRGVGFALQRGEKPVKPQSLYGFLQLCCTPAARSCSLFQA